MFLNTLVKLLPFMSFCASASASASLDRQKLHNANHLFNAVHSSMRQWGSSLNHNGMSFFLATVPHGTPLYHGSSDHESVRGTEWLAFEPEHALIFARPRRGPRQLHRDGQKPLGLSTSEDNVGVGYLHSYIAENNLRLLYIDGLSAAKTSNGTLDTQDMLLLNSSTSDLDGPMGGEYERARGLCNLASTTWEGRIDGFLRMEGGFEIILCDFEKDLWETDVVAITPNAGGGQEFLGGWPYIKAITSRYNGIGGDRVRIHHSDMVSVFSHPEIDGLFTNDVQSDYAMPRLQHVKRSDLGRVKDEITKMILQKWWGKGPSTDNWQKAADMVLARYSEPLHYLHTNRQIRTDQKASKKYLDSLLRPFIDHTARDTALEIRRCVAQLVPPYPNSLAHRAVEAITHRICGTLLESLSKVSTYTSNATHTYVLSQANELIDELVNYLQWTTWKSCGTCPDEEICYIPIWPMGTHEDHANPRCMSEGKARDRWSYWGY